MSLSGRKSRNSEVFSDLPCLSAICPAFETLRVQDAIPELIIETKNGEYVKAHRIILAARIPYFRNIELSKIEPKNMVVNLIYHCYDYVEAIVKYAYTGEITISKVNLEGILNLALQLKIDAVKEWCLSFVNPRVNTKNVQRWMNFAVTKNCKELQTICIRKMQEHFEDIVNSSLFTSLSAEHLIELVSSDDLTVSSEETVVNAIEKWTKAGESITEKNNRLLNIDELVTKVRWDATSHDFRMSTLATSDAFSHDKTVREIILQIDRQLNNPQANNTINALFNRSPRRANIIKKISPERTETNKEGSSENTETNREGSPKRMERNGENEIVLQIDRKSNNPQPYSNKKALFNRSPQISDIIEEMLQEEWRKMKKIRPKERKQKKEGSSKRMERSKTCSPEGKKKKEGSSKGMERNKTCEIFFKMDLQLNNPSSANSSILPFKLNSTQTMSPKIKKTMTESSRITPQNQNKLNHAQTHNISTEKTIYSPMTSDKF